ncbi:MAG: hypothetical protein MJY84_00325 [Bacteroidales bacterium]|nr:hypothetical protein [Bacteroidales bacterium]
MKIPFKRKLDRLLAKDSGKQLGWLFTITLLIIFTAILTVRLFFDDGDFSWEDVVAVFLDPGYALEAGPHYWFRIILAVLSTLVFSALLISVFTNIFDNISESVKNGERRYRLKGHVIVIGEGGSVPVVVQTLLDKGKTVVVLSENDPELGSEAYYYHGSQTDEEDILSTRPYDAECIYLTGNSSDPNHDALNLRTLAILKGAVPATDRKIPCFLSIREQEVKEVFQYMKNASESGGCGSGLLVNIIDEFEYYAEQLLVGTDYLPVITSSEDKAARFVIFGSGQVAVSTAVEIAHICHYPSFTRYGRRTVITMIDPDITECRQSMLAAHPTLFEMSHHASISGDGVRTEHVPAPDNDFQDIEWEFVEAGHNGSVPRDIIVSSAKDESTELRILVCIEDSHQAVECTLHLPEYARETSRTALYLNDSDDVIQLALSTGMYGDITIFGLANKAITDPLMENRLKLGQRVNFIYNKAYVTPPADSPEDAWYTISEADKCSSIFCACALPLRTKCFDIESDQLSVYEAEHRRWMMSALLMGYKPGPVKDKKRFIHPDIVPFESLPEEEKDKDKILIDAIDYILNKD